MLRRFPTASSSGLNERVVSKWIREVLAKDEFFRQASSDAETMFRL